MFKYLQKIITKKTKKNKQFQEESMEFEQIRFSYDFKGNTN